MAISYFKTVLNVGVQLLTMVLLVGVGKSFIDSYYGNMTLEPAWAQKKWA